MSELELSISASSIATFFNAIVKSELSVNVFGHTYT